MMTEIVHPTVIPSVNGLVETDLHTSYYQHGKLHRLDGPARVFRMDDQSHKEWWFEGHFFGRRHTIKSFKEAVDRWLVSEILET